jgi:hypothetical protein
MLDVDHNGRGGALGLVVKLQRPGPVPQSTICGKSG